MRNFVYNKLEKMGQIMCRGPRVSVKGKPKKYFKISNYIDKKLYEKPKNNVLELKTFFIRQSSTSTCVFEYRKFVK